MINLFWFCLIAVFYTYLGYPFLLFVFAKVFKKDVAKSPLEQGVSIVISAWNEEDVVKRRLDDLLSLDYPREKMEILIGSDGSSDRTNQIIGSFTDTRVRFFAFLDRRGKMAVLNDLLAHAQYEIIVFADCRQEFDPQAIRELVANFSDEKVGCVSGDLVLREVEGATSKGVGFYWRYEKFMRKCESTIHSMLGATGAIYAIRKRLFKRIPQHIVLDDMFIPLSIIEQGYRAVFDESAKAFDNAADNSKEEARRKKRTLFGNYQIFGIFLRLFIPGLSPVAVQFFSHKFLRVIAPFFLLAVFAVNVLIISGSGLYVLLFVLQIIFYALAFLGGLFRYADKGWQKIIKKAGYIPFVFCLLNFSALAGFFNFLKGRQNVKWDKARE